MTEEQARERAREWAEEGRKGCHASYNGGHHEPETNAAFHHGMDTVFNTLANGTGLPALILSIASEARQEERKRCEEIERALRFIDPNGERFVWPVGKTVAEILRRIKGSE